MVTKLMSDDKSILFFNTLFLNSGDSSDILRTQLKLTRKQCYSIISSLIKAELVKRKKGRYFVTAFGKVIYDAQRLLGNAVKNYCKLRAIDSLGVAHDDYMPKEERSNNRSNDRQLTNQRNHTFNNILTRVLMGQYRFSHHKYVTALEEKKASIYHVYNTRKV